VADGLIATMFDFTATQRRSLLLLTIVCLALTSFYNSKSIAALYFVAIDDDSNISSSLANVNVNASSVTKTVVTTTGEGIQDDRTGEESPNLLYFEAPLRVTVVWGIGKRCSSG
jgi:hypothetical protein